MESMPLFELALWGALAGFVLFRLWAVLGRKTGNERPPAETIAARRPAEESGVALPPLAKPSPAATGATATAGWAEAGTATPLGVALMALRQADRDFDPETFLSGAKGAHEIIASAFAEGNRAALKDLTDPDIYAAFDRAIAQREAAGLRTEFTYVRLKSAQIVDAALRGRMAEVTVKFESELMSGTRDAEGRVVEGDPTASRIVTDIWTFARDTRASDPNWFLAATQGEA